MNADEIAESVKNLEVGDEVVATFRDLDGNPYMVRGPIRRVPVGEFPTGSFVVGSKPIRYAAGTPSRRLIAPVVLIKKKAHPHMNYRSTRRVSA